MTLSAAPTPDPRATSMALYMRSKARSICGVDSSMAWVGGEEEESLSLLLPLLLL